MIDKLLTTIGLSLRSLRIAAVEHRAKINELVEAINRLEEEKPKVKAGK